ncbi:hypothetical protein KAZ66_00480 [Candidatus Woesebacteria bacterium]|nr:hypothetical protein [Candidatus Woesebacteria bacterium]
MHKKDLEDLLKVINSVFIQYTGKPLTMLVYEVNELQKKVSAIEDTLKSTMPVMAATALKMEALIEVASSQGIISTDSVDAMSNKLIDSVK